MLKWKQQALNDRNHIMTHIAQDKPLAAFELDELIEARAEDLLLSPMLGKAGRMAGTRELVIHPSYVMVYTTNKAREVTILRVLKTAQLWP
jgi:toxin ParE1/3/4